MLTRPTLLVLLASSAILTGCWSDRPPAPPPSPPPTTSPPNWPPADQADSRAELPNTPASKSLQRGIEWLLKAQHNDGSWRSENYGQLKAGAATTALALYALGHVPRPFWKDHTANIDRGFDFLDPGIKLKGYVCAPDGSTDFPTYATAMYITANWRLRGMLARLPPELIEYLVKSQLLESQGWQPDDSHYGGWDLVGFGQQPPHQTTGTNVSMASFVCEAFATPGNGQETKEPLGRAMIWLSRCRDVNDAGGYFFTPVLDDSLNKAGWRDEQRKTPRAYGSATCDALAIFKADIGRSRQSEIAAAVTWLIAHPSLDRVPGFEDSDEENGWGEALLFYYYASLAKVLDQFPPESAADFRNRLTAKLLELQRSDGSWKNSAGRMREDDPLIATAFAIIALGRCMEWTEH